MKYSISEVFEMLGPENLMVEAVRKSSRESIEVDGFQVYTKSLRYATFYQHGTDCVCCGKRGAYFQLDADRAGGNVDNRRHFNLYTEDGTLMTKDHILPRKYGGRDLVSNLQPMCEECNKKKGCTYDAPIDGITATTVDNPDKKLTFLNMEDAIFHAVDRSHIMSSNIKPGKMVRRTITVAMRLYEVIDTTTPYMGYIWKHESFTVEGKPYIDGGTNK